MCWNSDAKIRKKNETIKFRFSFFCYQRFTIFATRFPMRRMYVPFGNGDISITNVPLCRDGACPVSTGCENTRLPLISNNSTTSPDCHSCVMCNTFVTGFGYICRGGVCPPRWRHVHNRYDTISKRKLHSTHRKSCGENCETLITKKRKTKLDSFVFFSYLCIPNFHS